MSRSPAINRTKRAEIAQETIRILECGEYDHPLKDGETISILEDLQKSCDGTVVIHNATSMAWQHERGAISLEKGGGSSDEANTAEKPPLPAIYVTNASTFAAAREVSLRENTDDVYCLNFASAKNPGGGFKGGSQAQEEALARASGLYSCLLQAPEYYKTNRKFRSALYQDLVIYSPGVPVFRDEDGELTAHPWKTSIVTAPAPNRGALLRNRPSDLALVEETFERRIDMILSTAMHFGHRHIVLGAWGCGVFQNDPRDVAQYFRNALMRPSFGGAFDSVTFAVLALSKDNYTLTTFEETFADIAAPRSSFEEEALKTTEE